MWSFSASLTTDRSVAQPTFGQFFFSKHCKNESHVLAICFMQTSWSSSTSPLCQNIMIPTSCPSLALLGPPRDRPSWASWTSTLLAPCKKWQEQMGLSLSKNITSKMINLSSSYSKCFYLKQNVLKRSLPVVFFP